MLTGPAPVQQTTVVAIGRNRGDVPMDETEWRLFRSLTYAAVHRHCGTVYSATTGPGVFEDAPEESGVFVAGPPVQEAGPVAFERALAVLAGTFGQESVAVTYGETRFVAARAPVDTDPVDEWGFGG